MKPKLSIQTAVDFTKIFWPEFVDINGSVFLLLEEPYKLNNKGFDKTGMEALTNHYHIADLFNINIKLEPVGDYYIFNHEHSEFKMLCDVGKVLAQVWYQKLKIDFPKYRFRVYYTQEDDPIVRFHCVRPDEPFWLDEKNYVEEVRIGNIVVYDTGELN
jgi:hypothetical protein